MLTDNKPNTTIQEEEPFSRQDRLSFLRKGTATATSRDLPGEALEPPILLPPIDEDVFRILIDEVEKTKEAHQQAKERFWAAAARPRELPRVPTGRESPDGSEQIRKAVTEEHLALKARIEAMARLNQYLSDRTVPDDVQAKLRKTKSRDAA